MKQKGKNNSMKMKKSALSILRNYAGDYFAELYGNFYEDKDDVFIETSLNEIMVELVGERKAREVLNKELTTS